MKRTLSMFLCAIVLAIGIMAFGVSAETYYPDADGLYTAEYSFEPTSEYILVAIKGVYDQTNYIEAYNESKDEDVIYVEQKMSDENGNITFGPFAPNGYFDATLVVGGNGFEEPYLAGYLSAKDCSNASSVEIFGVDSVYTAVGLNGDDIVVELKTEVYDSFGYPSVTGEVVDVKIESLYDDVTLDGNILTISRFAKAQMFSVVATIGDVTDEVFVKVERQDAEHSYIEIFEDASYKVVADSINVLGPAGKFPEVTVYAKTFDQYKNEIEDTYSYVYGGNSVGVTFTPVLGMVELKVKGSTGIEKVINVITTEREDYAESALELYNLIAQCNARISEEKIISVESGRDVFPGQKWISQADVENFSTAIYTAHQALELYGTEGYSDADYADEVAALKKALSTYNKAFKDGIRVDIEEISIKEQNVQVLLGDEADLTFMVSPKLSDTTDRIVWKSSNESIAIVFDEDADDNIVTIVTKTGGKVTITAETRSGLKAQTDVFVIRPTAKLELTPREVTAKYGDEPVVLSVGMAANAYDIIEWTVIETGDILDIAVSADGRNCTIIPKRAGQAKVTATAVNSKKSATSTVYVEMPNWKTAANPVANFESGSVLSGTQVSLASETEGVTIYYTLDGTVPSKENGREYKAPITISQDVTLMAIAVGNRIFDSEVVRFDYKVVPSAVRVDSVTTRAGKTFKVNVSVEDFSNVKDAKIEIGYNADMFTVIAAEYSCEYVDESLSNSNTIVLHSEDGFDFDGKVATFTFQAKENVAEGDYAVEVVTAKVVASDETTFDAATFDGNINVNNFIIGDADNNGKVGLSDVIMIKQYIAGDEYAKNNIELNAADVDADGDVDSDDAALLTKYCTGWNVTLG